MVQQRHEMYRSIHKALRHRMFSTAHTLGIADFREEGEARDAISSLERVINYIDSTRGARRELYPCGLGQTSAGPHRSIRNRPSER